MLWPVLNCFNLPLVHLNAVLTDDIIEEVDGVLMEFTLLKVSSRVRTHKAYVIPASCGGNVPSGSRSIRMSSM